MGHIGKQLPSRIVTGSDIAAQTVGGSNLALGTYEAFTSVTSGTSGLGVSSKGLVKIDASGGAVILNLPAANLVTSPVLIYRLIRVDSSANSVTINRAGSDTIKFGTSSVTSFTLSSSGGEITLMSDGASAWYASGAASLYSTPEFAASGTTSGYQKLPGGLIMQWGTIASGGSQDGSTTFPLQFPTACYVVVPSPTASSNLTINVDTISTTGFNYYRRVANTAGTSTAQANWIAFGR